MRNVNGRVEQGERLRLAKTGMPALAENSGSFADTNRPLSSLLKCFSQVWRLVIWKRTLNAIAFDDRTGQLLA